RAHGSHSRTSDGWPPPGSPGRTTLFLPSRSGCTRRLACPPPLRPVECVEYRLHHSSKQGESYRLRPKPVRTAWCHEVRNPSSTFPSSPPGTRHDSTLSIIDRLSR